MRLQSKTCSDSFELEQLTQRRISIEAKYLAALPVGNCENTNVGKVGRSTHRKSYPTPAASDSGAGADGMVSRDGRERLWPCGGVQGPGWLVVLQMGNLPSVKPNNTVSLSDHAWKYFLYAD